MVTLSEKGRYVDPASGVDIANVTLASSLVPLQCASLAPCAGNPLLGIASCEMNDNASPFGTEGDTHTRKAFNAWREKVRRRKEGWGEEDSTVCHVRSSMYNVIACNVNCRMTHLSLRGQGQGWFAERLVMVVGVGVHEWTVWCVVGVLPVVELTAACSGG